MSSTFPLPLECLQLIIRKLADQRDCNALTTLLRVNKYVCSATLPILFEDPCKGQLLTPIYDRSGGHDGTILGRRNLVQLLLRSLPSDNGHITDLLSLSYFLLGRDPGQDKAQNETKINMEPGQGMISPIGEISNAATPTSLPYYLYITKITFEEVISGTHAGYFRMSTHQDFPRLLSFIRKTGRVQQYTREDPRHSIMFKHKVERSFLIDAAEREIRRDLTWVFCHANAEYIQTLCVSVSDIGRYRALIPRLRALTDVSFHIVMGVKLPGLFQQELTEDEKLVLNNLQKDHIRQLEEMIQFVEEHQRFHSRSIKNVKCTSDWAYDCPCPEEYQLRLLRLLPPLSRPLYIDHRNWYQFVAHVTETDLSFVKTIDFTKISGFQGTKDQNFKWDQIFQSCRALESVSLISPDENVFKWAVQERKAFSKKAEVVELAPRSLVSLRKYHVLFTGGSSACHIKDILFAFNNTLENITVNFERSNNAEDFYFDLGGSILANADNDAYNDISYLQFPRLKSLFATSWTRTLIRLHPTFLARCPNLEHIVLPDDGDREVSEVNTFGEPAELPNLLVLELSCHSALSFHPDTLKSTKRLERLTLYANEAEHHDNQDSKSDNTTLTIFSVQRPIWTWDWNLPNLTYLRLCVAFGYRFQFRMLEGTPSLRELIVDSNSNVHRRIGFEDLIKPGFHHSQLDRFLCRFGQKRKEASFILAETTNDQMGNDKNEDNTVDGNIWEEFEYIHLPLLESFMLSGKWELDERALQVLFKKVMPHVQKLDILFCIGYSLSEWVESTSLYLHELREARTNISKTSQMIADSGLVEKARPGYYNTWYILAVQPKDRLLNTPAYYDLL